MGRRREVLIRMWNADGTLHHGAIVEGSRAGQLAAAWKAEGWHVTLDPAPTPDERLDRIARHLHPWRDE